MLRTIFYVKMQRTHLHTLYDLGPISRSSQNCRTDRALVSTEFPLNFRNLRLRLYFNSFWIYFKVHYLCILLYIATWSLLSALDFALLLFWMFFVIDYNFEYCVNSALIKVKICWHWNWRLAIVTLGWCQKSSELLFLHGTGHSQKFLMFLTFSITNTASFFFTQSIYLFSFLFLMSLFLMFLFLMSSMLPLNFAVCWSFPLCQTAAVFKKSCFVAGCFLCHAWII